MGLSYFASDFLLSFWIILLNGEMVYEDMGAQGMQSEVS